MVDKNQRQIIMLKITDLLYTSSWKAVTRFQALHHTGIARGQKQRLCENTVTAHLKYQTEV